MSLHGDTVGISPWNQHSLTVLGFPGKQPRRVRLGFSFLREFSGGVEVIEEAAELANFAFHMRHFDKCSIWRFE